MRWKGAFISTEWFLHFSAWCEALLQIKFFWSISYPAMKYFNPDWSGLIQDGSAPSTVHKGSLKDLLTLKMVQILYHGLQSHDFIPRETPMGGLTPAPPTEVIPLGRMMFETVFSVTVFVKICANVHPPQIVACMSLQGLFFFYILHVFQEQIPIVIMHREYYLC